MRPSPRAAFGFVHAALLCAALAAPAAVKTDGTVGPRRTLAGPSFNVGADLGQQRGGNLFHSFTTLDLAAGESATFSGPSSVHNVLARVTGGAVTSIDGTLRCDIPKASFYLINPSGVIFGPNAALDVKGSFAVTTASAIRLGASGSFDAAQPSASALSTAAPSAFGFLGAHAAGITVQGSAGKPVTLEVQQGNGLSMVGGSLRIEHGTLIAPGGRLSLVAVASAGEAKIGSASGPEAPGDVDSFTQFADVSVTRNTNITLDGPAGGGFFIAGADVGIDRSTISSTTLGSARGLDGEIQATGFLRLTRAGFISVATSGSGAGGALRVTAGGLLCDGAGDTSLTGLSVASNEGAAGRAGDLTIQADSIRIVGGAQLSASTSGAGAGGDLNLASKTLTLDDRGDLDPTTETTGIFVRSRTGAAGAGGNLTIHTGTLRVLAGAEISASTFSSGRAGDLVITADDITLDDRGDLAPALNVTGIFASANSSATGAAGNLSITAGTLTLRAAAEISAETTGPGAGGNVHLSVGELTIDDTGNRSGGNLTGIFVDTFSTDPLAGRGGSLTLDADLIHIRSGGLITADTFGEGDGGDVRITAREVTLDGAGSTLFTGIAAKAHNNATGRAGNLSVRATNVSVLAGAQIEASTSGAGAGGDLTVTATRLIVDDTNDPDPSTKSTGLFTTSLSASPGAGDAGRLTLHADDLQVLAGAKISASTFGPGTGGDLTITAGSVTIDNRGNGTSANITGLFAESKSTDPGAGHAGNLTIHADSLRILAGAEISADTLGAGRGGDLQITAHELTLDDRGDPDPQNNLTSISADTRSSSPRAGDAGNLTIHADSVKVLAGAEISATTFSSGRGGDLTIAAHDVTVDDRGDAAPDVNVTGIFAEANVGSTAAAGNLTIRASLVNVLAGAEISATTFGPGRGGNLTVTASVLTLDDRGDLLPGVNNTTVSAAASDGASGAAGNLTIYAGTVSVLAGANISTSTMGPGRAGDLRIDADNVTLDDRGNLAPDVKLASIFSESNTVIRHAGAAGDVSIRADVVNVLTGSSISATTFGPGTGGSVAVSANSVRVDGANAAGFLSGITAKAQGSGNAGSVLVSGKKSVKISGGGSIAASSFFSSGGDVRVESDGRIELDHGTISANAQRAGGSVVVDTPLFVQLVHRSSIITQSTAGDGGNITIDPLILSMSTSRINANGAVNGGNIVVNVDSMVGVVFTGPPGSRNMTATGATGVGGNIQNGPANSDIAHALARLPGDLQEGQLTLAPQCNQRTSVSTFLIQGRGSVAEEPGFWQNEVDLSLFPRNP